MRSRKTRSALSAAVLALIEARPFDQLTIREITARAGVGYASFFRHYPSKAALLDDIAADEVAALIDRTTPAFSATDTQAAALALCRSVAEHAPLWTALLTGGAADAVRGAFIRQASRLAAELPAPDRAWLPPELGVIHGVSSIVEILAWWLPRRADYSIEAAATIVDRLVLSPAATMRD